MTPTATSARLSATETAVLKVVVYADLFDCPVNQYELWRWLSCPAKPEEVERAVAALTPRYLTQLETGIVLRGRESITGPRERRRETSRELTAVAERYGRMIARLPNVRMVALTGSLAVENADEGDDFDYLVVTAPGRVWFTRGLVTLIVHYAALQGRVLCPNYLLSETALALADRDVYTARELLQMKPVSGFSTYRRLLYANDWWREHLPNAPLARAPRDKPPSRLRCATEWLLRRKPFDQLEAWLLASKGSALRRQAGPEAVFDESRCKGHFGGWRERTNRLIEERLQALREANA